MGASSSGSRSSSCNGSIEVKSVDEKVSADAGALFMRELMERSGLVAVLEERLLYTRRPGSVEHSVGNLLHTFLLLIVQGGTDQDDEDRLRQDPSFRASARGTRGCEDEGGLASQPALSRYLGMLSPDEILEELRQRLLKNAVRRLRRAFISEAGGKAPDWVTVDIDVVPLLVHGHQPGSGCDIYG